MRLIEYIVSAKLSFHQRMLEERGPLIFASLCLGKDSQLINFTNVFNFKMTITTDFFRLLRLNYQYTSQTWLRFGFFRSAIFGTATLVVLVLSIGPASAETPSAPPSSAPTQLSEEQIEQIILDGDRLVDQKQFQAGVEKYTEAYMSVVANLRGQPFKTKVVPKLMNREELAKEMTEQFKTELTPEELKLMEATYKALGLAPDSLDLEKTMIKLYTEEVGGFYDPRTKAMVLIHDVPKAGDSAKKKGIFDWFSETENSFDKEEQKTTLAHELTHALQDQHHDLETQTDLVSGDDDMMLAYSSLVEGDATLVMFVDMGREEGNSDELLQMDPQIAEAMFGMMKMTLPIASGNTYRTAPKIFRESLLFPYMNGMAFTMNLTRRDRFREVDRAFLSPPVSTEQILHPKKYLFQPDEPVAVTIPGAETLLGSEWSHLGGNCLGEFQTTILLDDVDLERVAATGWDGDRYEVYQSADNNLALVWASVWDSNTDAEEFASTYQKYVARKIRQLAETQRSEDQPVAESLTENRWNIDVNQTNDRVVIVQGIDSSQAAIVMEKVIPFTTQTKVFPFKIASEQKTKE